MAKSTRRNARGKKAAKEAQEVTSTADLGGARQTTESQEERNEINRKLAENKKREEEKAITHTSPSQTATSDELNDAEQKRRDAMEASEVGVVRALRNDAVKRTVEQNRDPATLAHDINATRDRFDSDQQKAQSKRAKTPEDPDPTVQGVQPLVVTEGHVPQTSINSRTTTVDPRTTTITNRRDGNPPTGDTELAIRSQSISGRIDGAPAHVPPDAVDRIRRADDTDRHRVLHGAQSSSIAGAAPVVAPRARPLGETSLKEAQGLPHVGEGSASGLVGVVPNYEMERHDAPSSNVSGSKNVFVQDSYQQAQAAERQRQEAVANAKRAQEEADARKARKDALKTRKPKGKPRAKGNKGKRKGKAGSKH
jgi:hypothetical protein